MSLYRKRLLPLLGAVIMVLAMAGCGAPEEEQPEEQISYEIAMVTDVGIIMDGGYSEVAWTAISEFGADKGISHKYYKASEATEESYRAAIDTAVAKGAKVVVADGALFEDVVYDAQKQYTDVKFILIDAEPMDGESGEIKIADNTMAILFSSEEAGYLAGYGAVKEGLTRLGFMGASEQPVIADYGYGFLEGAEAAAAEQGISVDVKYHYCSDEDREAVLKQASEWYTTGTEVIFASGAHVEMPVIEAAELYEGKVIGCETDKSQMSDTVLTSAVKDMAAALKEALKQYASDKFAGGEVISYDLSNEGVWLELEKGRFGSFTQEDYEDISERMIDGNITVKDHTAGDMTALGLTHVTVTEE